MQSRNEQNTDPEARTISHQRIEQERARQNDPGSSVIGDLGDPLELPSRMPESADPLSGEAAVLVI